MVAQVQPLSPIHIGMPFAKQQKVYQPAHQRILIRVFVTHSLESAIAKSCHMQKSK